MEEIENRRDEQKIYLFMVLFYTCYKFLSPILVGCDLDKDITEDFFPEVV